MKDFWSNIRRCFTNRLLQALLLVLLGIGLGASGSRLIPPKQPTVPVASELGTRLPSGPWGELYRVPFSISAPEELIPLRTIEAGGTHWLLKNFTVSEFAHLLTSTDLPASLENAWLDPAVARVAGRDVELTPTPEMIISLPAKARQIIYRQLAQFPENGSALAYIHKTCVGERFDGSGVSPQTLALFRTLCSEHGDYLVFGGLPAMLTQLPAYEEKVRFMKALTRQKTMLLRLRLTKDSDVADLSRYWGRGPWAANVRTILESIDQVPGGTFMSLMALLPPQPSSQLYFYPVPRPASPNQPAPVRDCHWTSLNFFRTWEDQEPVDPASFVQQISENYYPLSGDPRYGDVLILTRPDGGIVHSAVFIAADVVFTKNGATEIYPWMLSTVPDLLKHYSFQAPEGQQLSVRYFRSKDG